LPPWGWVVRHAKDVPLRNLVFETAQPDVRPAIADFDTAGLTVE